MQTKGGATTAEGYGLAECEIHYGCDGDCIKPEPPPADPVSLTGHTGVLPGDTQLYGQACRSCQTGCQIPGTTLDAQDACRTAGRCQGSCDRTVLPNPQAARNGRECFACQRYCEGQVGGSP